MSYTIILDEGVVLRDSDGAQVAPCQSADDLDFMLYASYIDSGGEVSQVASRNIALDLAPESVSRFQARAALWQMGYLDDVEAYMALETTDMMAKLAWRDAQDFRIDSVFVLAVAPLIGFNDSQLRDMFRFAKTITG